MADIIYNNSADFIFHNDEDIDTGDIWWMRNIPALTTDAIADLTDDSVTANGTITELGGENSTRRGFCYKIGDTGDPTILDTIVYNDGDFSLGVFLEAIASLTTGKKYQIRAYAVNSAGVGYGSTVYFITDLALSDSVILGDALANNIGLNKSDLFALGDTLANNPSINKSDSISITDSMLKNILTDLQDSLIIADDIVKNITIPEFDTILLSDSLYKNIIHHLQDLFVLRDDFSATLITGIAEYFRDMVVVPARVRSVSAPARKRQVICTPIHLQGGNMDCSLETDLLEFSPKQNWEEYYAVFNFARVITPLTTIAHTTILVYDEAGVEVSETFTDDTKTQITGAKVFVWVRGGTEQTYKITCRIIMSNGEKFEQDATLEVVEV